MEGNGIWHVPRRLNTSSNVWIKECKHINWHARVFIALYNWGFSLEEMALFLGVHDWQLQPFWELLEETDHPIVRAAMDHGLPVHCCAALPYQQTVVCPGCGEETKYIPCVRCAASGRKHNPYLQISDEDSIHAPKAPKPTDAIPGSTEKIEVMRARYSAGEAVFHRDDPRFVW